jgi:hypothetical protein
MERRTPAIEHHAACTGNIMLFETALLYRLLGHDVACGEEDGGRDALREDGPGSQPPLIPCLL